MPEAYSIRVERNALKEILGLPSKPRRQVEGAVVTVYSREAPERRLPEPVITLTA